METEKYIQEGKIVLYEAPQRCGKTLGLVLSAYSAYRKGKQVLSNLPLKFPEVDGCLKPKPLRFRDLQIASVAEDFTAFQGSHISLDELNFIFNNREHGGQTNKQFIPFCLQIKKQGVDFEGTTHNLMYLDKVIRENFDYLIKTQVYPITRPNGAPPTHLRQIIDNGPVRKRFHKEIIIPLDGLLGLYDTTHVFNPWEGVEVGKRSKKIESECKNPNASYYEASKTNGKIEKLLKEYVPFGG